MKDRKELKISFWSSHLTTIVTVTLVLLIVGVIAMLGVAAHKQTSRLGESIELSVIMADSVSDAQADALARKIEAMQAVNSATVVTSAQAMEEWNRETGEDLEALFNVNPFSPEIVVTLNAPYATAEALPGVVDELRELPDVETVSQPEREMVQNMQEGIGQVAWVLGIIGAAMLLISFVLINNTVRLAIYARRFTIHTMQLVGATDGYIRGPFTRSSALIGVISGLAASAILAGAVAAADSSGVPASASITWPVMAIIGAGLIAVGVVVCCCASALATRRYLRADYDDLFK